MIYFYLPVILPHISGCQNQSNGYAGLSPAAITALFKETKGKYICSKHDWMKVYDAS